MTDITDISKEYLIKFLKFEKKLLGYEPIIIGGWAVYALTQKEQSVDIDVLLKSSNDIEKIKAFFEKYKFEMEQEKDTIIFERTLKNPQEIKGINIQSIIFDIMTTEQPNKVSGTHNVEIPWKLAYDHNIKIKLENLEIRIPSPELLIIYKAKAFIDRNHDKIKFHSFMKNKKAWIKRKDFKIEKDKRDIQNLINSGTINEEKLEELLEKTKFKNAYDEVRQSITAN